MNQTTIILPNTAKVMLRNRCYRHVDKIEPGDKLLYKKVPAKQEQQIDSYTLVQKAEKLPFALEYKSIKTNMWHSHVLFSCAHKLLMPTGEHKQVTEIKEGEQLVTPYHGQPRRYAFSLEHNYGYIIGTVVYSGYSTDNRTVIYFENPSSLEKFKKAWWILYPCYEIIETKPASVSKLVIEHSPFNIKPGEIIERYCGESAEFARGVIDAYKENLIVNASQELYELYVWANSFTGTSNHYVIAVDKIPQPQASTLLTLDVEGGLEEMYLCVNNSLMLV